MSWPWTGSASVPRVCRSPCGSVPAPGAHIRHRGAGAWFRGLLPVLYGAVAADPMWLSGFIVPDSLICRLMFSLVCSRYLTRRLANSDGIG